jgi:hypothetical protein
MLPTKSNTADKACSPVSSNCVIWQGPDISCINLCNGDAISDVVYKLANQLCTVQTSFNLSTLDLSCLVSFCSATNPAPTGDNKTLSAVLDFIIDKVCCLNTTIQNLPTGSTYTEPNLALPTCLQYNDPATGQPVIELVHRQYSLRLANQYCILKATVDGQASTLATYNTRITALENRPAQTLPTVTPNCILPATATAVNIVLDKLEEEYCNLRSVLGSNTGITSAVGQQCQNLASQNALSQTGFISGLTGWVPTSGNALSGTLAGAVKNLWVVLCDMRAAIYDLKTTAGATDCSSFLLGFSAAANEARTTVTLFFSGTTVVPAGFANCNAQGSKVTIKDTAGKTFTGYVDLIAAQTDTDGVPFTITSAGLNTSQNYLVTVEGCVSKNGNSCTKVATFTVSLPCPIITSVTATLE